MLDAHEAAGGGLFRGIRDALCRAEHPEALTIPGQAPAGLSVDPAFRAGVRRLGERGLTYDTWHYHFQIREFTDLARAVPDTVMVLDHFGTPLGVGPYATQREEIFESWTQDITELARCENVVVKLGGLAMPDNGFGWNAQPRPPTSDEFVAAQERYYLHTIEAFGPERCMFESNFPVDRFSLSYRVLWNAFKKLTAALLGGRARGDVRRHGAPRLPTLTSPAQRTEACPGNAPPPGRPVAEVARSLGIAEGRAARRRELLSLAPASG